MSLAYIDSSALVKLVLDEADAGPMRRWYVEAERVTSSVIGLIETRRAVARKVDEPDHVNRILRTVVTLELDGVVAAAASRVTPLGLRTLDAIHIATALTIGSELGSFVTYDDHLAEAARAVGLPVVRPV
jgi:predicted nucleic acid-binding protein